MTISSTAWEKYIALLRKVNDKAAELVRTYLEANQIPQTQKEMNALIEYAYAVSTKYGEAAAAAAAGMYDGIATGRYCLDKMGFTNVTYHAYEIDKYPIMVAMDNYPDIIQHGDAFAVREDDWKPPRTRSEWLDELLGGV